MAQPEPRPSRSDVLMEPRTRDILEHMAGLVDEGLAGYARGHRAQTWSAVLQILALNAELIGRLRVKIELGE